MAVKFAGRNGAIYMDPLGTSTYTWLRGMNTWAIDLGTDEIDVSEFQDTNKTTLVGLENGRITISGFHRNDEDKLYQGRVNTRAGIASSFIIYPSTNDSPHYFAGHANVSLNSGGNMGGAVTLAANLAPSDNWVIAY
jgi:hypothetical protein